MDNRSLKSASSLRCCNASPALGDCVSNWGELGGSWCSPALGKVMLKLLVYMVNQWPNPAISRNQGDISDIAIPTAGEGIIVSSYAAKHLMAVENYRTSC